MTLTQWQQTRTRQHIKKIPGKPPTHRCGCKTLHTPQHTHRTTNRSRSNNLRHSLLKKTLRSDHFIVLQTNKYSTRHSSQQMFTPTLTRTTRLPSPPCNPVIMMKPWSKRLFDKHLTLVINNNAPPRQPELNDKKTLCTMRYINLDISTFPAQWMSPMLVVYTTISQSNLDRNTMLSFRNLTTCPHVDWHRCVKRPPP